MQPAPLVHRLRSGEIESTHHGHLVVVDAEGRILTQRGAPQAVIYARSSLKPIQALPFVLSGAADAYGAAASSLAIACASHAGEPAHVEEVNSLLARCGLRADQLRCGAHAPLDPAAAAALERAGEAPTARHCNCSGKHAAMLAVCRHEGWDMAGYTEPDHPLQRWIRELVAEFAGLAPAELGHGVDGCGVPVWRLPIIGLARAFARLGAPEALAPDLAAAARRVADAMAAHPHLVSGTNRLDTVLLCAGAGRLIAKIGGEGVHAGADREAGCGWALKIADGNKRAIAPALDRALAEAGLAPPLSAEWRALVASPVTTNTAREVGRLSAAW